MSVQLRSIHVAPATDHARTDRVRARAEEGRNDFAALLDRETADTASVIRRPGTATTPTVPRTDNAGRTLPSGSSQTDGGTGTGASDGNLAGHGNEVTSTGTLSDNPRTAGMYVPPDFYHGTSYSPVFDQQDANGNWVHTPRFEGQVIYGPWRGSLPPDYDPNARVAHDPLNTGQGPNFWKQDANGNWVKRETGYGGIPLNDDGKPIWSPDPIEYPEYYVGADEESA
ncbi:hypothetical protein K2Z84_06380 [Candidatus Binatia bacterium]|nr:hypothetical protein [Candidatus Binatia bacterium]